MTVSDLIKELKKYPQDIQVAYQCYSEQCLLESRHISVEVCCKPREDGWIHHKRSDKPTQEYLMFPGN